MSITGKVISASNPDRRGGTLAVDTVATDTVLVLEEALDFDDDETATRWLTIAAESAVEYVDVDYDAATVTLAAEVGSVIEAGLPVEVWDPTVLPDGAPAVEYLVKVDLGDESQPFDVLVPHEKVPLAGVETLVGATVALEPVDPDEEEDGGDWFVSAILGREPVIDSSFLDISWEANDSYVLTTVDIAAGTVTIELTRVPVEESLVLFWGGVPQPPTEYVVDYDAATVTCPLAGFEEAGDQLWVHYAYRALETPPSNTGPVYGDVESLVQRGVYTGAGGLVPLPAGTQVGDVIVALACGVNDGGKNDTVLSGAIADDRMTHTFGSPSGRTWWGQVTNLDPLNIDIPVGGWAIFATYGSADPADTLLLTEVEITSNVDEDGATGHMVTFVHAPRSWSSVVVAIIEDLGVSSDPPLFTGFTGSVDDRDLGLQYWTGSPPSPEIVWADDDNYQRYDRTLITMSVVSTS